MIRFKRSTPKSPKKEETTGEMVRSFFIAILIALVFRSVAYEPFHIPSGSMLSTLYQGDYIFVSKLSYGYSRYSFPFGMDFFDGRKFFTEPKRGDIIVFRPPGKERTDYIKRLIGLPGDRIQMKNGRLYINGTAVEVTFRTQMQVPNEEGGLYKVRRYTETLPGGVQHTILDTRDGNLSCVERVTQAQQCQNWFDSDNTPEYLVPEKHYFMMGDNRDNSEDSRFKNGVGFVPEENLVGRAEIIFLSLKGGVPIWKIWEWPKAFRNDRWFTSLGHE